MNPCNFGFHAYSAKWINSPDPTIDGYSFQTKVCTRCNKLKRKRV